MKITDKQLEDIKCYNTDKFNNDINTICHHYGDYYNSILEPLENSKISLLEIGIQKGGSVRLFSDYLKKSKIFGVDINDQWEGPTVNNYKNLSLYFFDAYDINNINSLPIKSFDIIIDDGPHTIESQIFFLSRFTDYLNINGKLILEDVNYKNLERILEESMCDKSKIKIFKFDSKYKIPDDIIIEYTNDK